MLHGRNDLEIPIPDKTNMKTMPVSQFAHDESEIDRRVVAEALFFI